MVVLLPCGATEMLWWCCYRAVPLKCYVGVAAVRCYYNAMVVLLPCGASEILWWCCYRAVILKCYGGVAATVRCY